MDVSAANTPKAAQTRPTGPARPAASVTPNRSNVAGSYSEGVTKTEMAVMLATRMTGVLNSPAPMAAYHCSSWKGNVLYRTGTS